MSRTAIGMVVAFVALFTFAGPEGAWAQEAATDSLRTQIEALEARIDSLVAELSRQAERTDSTEVAAAEDELAALRRAARRAAGTDSAAVQADSAVSQDSRSGDLSALNPEISVTGDLVAGVAAPSGGVTEYQAVPREFEFSFQAALDPYARARVYVSYEQEIAIAGLEEPTPIGDVEDPPGEVQEDSGSPFDLEEGYAYWVGLPGGFGLKAGKFRQQIGLFNRWHNHALPQIDRSLPAVAFFGDDGLIQTGASVLFPTFAIGRAYQTIWFELTAASNDILFGANTDASFLGRFQSFVDISPSTYLQVGVAGVIGGNEFDRQSSAIETDLAFRWAPPARQLYQELLIKAEWYWARRELSLAEQRGNGGSAQATYRLSRRWVVGARVDYLDNFGSDPSIVMLVPTIDWWQSEWVRVRLQYNYVKPDGGGGNHTFLLQTVFAFGPHRHETY